MSNISKKFLEEKQYELVYRGLKVIDEINKLTESVRKCLLESKTFPIYMLELQEKTRILGHLTVKYVGLEELKQQITRRK